MSFAKLPAIEGGLHPCLCCGVIAETFPSEGWIAVGFGYAGLTRNGLEVWRCDYDLDDDQIMTGAKAEELAKADPGADWRIHLEGPLSGRTYQRHADNTWVLVEKNEGFA